MTVKQARKILVLEEHVSDEEMCSYIETAEILKNLFFSKILKEKEKKPKMTSFTYLNMP